MSEITETHSGEWARGWPIVLSSLVGIALCLSPLPYYSLISLMPVLSGEFGWTIAQTSGGFLCMTIGVLLGAPIAGYLTDRFGARKVLLPSIIMLGLGMMSFSLMNGELWVYYAIFTTVSFLSVGTLPITWSKAIVNNFDKKRGLALGIALLGTGLYGFLAPAYVQGLVDRSGWQAAYIGVGILPLVLSFPLAFFLFRDRKEEAAIADRQTGSENYMDLPGLTMPQVLRDYRFYIILISFLVLGAAVSGILANSKVILMDKGYTPQQASDYFIGAGVIGLAVIAGRVIGGIVVDYIWAPLIAFVFMLLPALACFLLMQDGSIATNTFALVLTGLAAGVEYDLMAYLVSRYLGMRSYGRVYGFIYAAFGLGSGASPLIYNKIREATGNYDVILWIAMFGFLIGATMLLSLGKYRDFDDEALLIRNVKQSI